MDVQGKLNMLVIMSGFDILCATLATPKDVLVAVHDIFMAYSFECRFS